MAPRLPVICLVTDRHRLEPSTPDQVVRLAASAAAAGVDLIHVRERDLDDRELLALIQRAVAAVKGTSAKVVVNDRVDVAVAAGAAGVHLRADSIRADRVRAVSPPGFVLGRSVHAVEEAVAAARSGVDYLVMGTIYATSSKAGMEPLTGVQDLEAACRAVVVPVLAIGGVTADKLSHIAAAGAAGIAAIGLFSEVYNANRQGNPDAALAALVSTIRGAFTPSAARS